MGGLDEQAELMYVTNIQNASISGFNEFKEYTQTNQAQGLHGFFGAEHAGVEKQTPARMT